jgi:hypothetical protein
MWSLVFFFFLLLTTLHIYGYSLKYVIILFMCNTLFVQ